jgi:hypothetical protein
VAGQPVRSDESSSTPSSVRDPRATGVYDAALILYGVLIGLALFDPLDRLAQDLVGQPLSGDWQFRFVALGMLAEVAAWLPLLLAAIRSQNLADESSPRHPTLPGSLSFVGLWRTELHSWAGATVVVALIVLAKASSRSLPTFLTAYLVYRSLDLLWLSAFLILSAAKEPIRFENFLRPIRLIQKLKGDRHVPTTESDIVRLHGSAQAIEEMWDRVFWFYVWIAVANMAIGTLLLVFSLSWETGGVFIAALWFTNVLATHVTEQRYLPQFYGL